MYLCVDSASYLCLIFNQVRIGQNDRNERINPGGMKTTTVQCERVWGWNDLWMESCSRYGAFVPLTTFRDWVFKACLLDIKSEYTDEEAAWILEEWIPFQRRYPKRSTVKVKRFHEQMKEKQLNARTNTRTA